MPSPPPHPGWIDTHSHILPGLDDGSRSIEESLEMAAVAREDGIAHIVCTPHANFQFEFQPARVAAALAALQEALDGAGPALSSGCEMHLTYDNVRHVLAQPAAYTLNRGRYLLVEFPEFFDGPAVAGVLEQLQQAGLMPVLAHPERNAVFTHHPEVLERYLAMGCVAQLTAASFTGRFGKSAQQASARMLQRGQVHVVASDAHSPSGRPPRIRAAFDFIARQQNETVALQVCSANPLALAENRTLPFQPESGKKKSIFSALFGR